MKIVEEILWGAKFASSLRDGYSPAHAAERAHSAVQGLRDLDSSLLAAPVAAMLEEARGLQTEHARAPVPLDKRCKVCGSYTTTSFCSRACAARVGRGP